jgi:hypothetical protein
LGVGAQGLFYSSIGQVGRNALILYDTWSFFGDTLFTEKLDPSITTPPVTSPITFGEAASHTVLSGGVASTIGTFSLSNPGAMLDAGTQTVEVTFTPRNAVVFNAFIITVNLVVDKAAQTIAQTSGPAPGEIPEWLTSFVIEAQSSQSLDVHLSAQGDCSLSGTTVRVVASGVSCTVTASQAGTANVMAADDLVMTFRVVAGMPVVPEAENTATGLASTGYSSAKWLPGAIAGILLGLLMVLGRRRSLPFKV